MPIKYRLSGRTLAMFLDKDRHMAPLLPHGAIITTDGKKFNGEKLLTWDDKVMMMFTHDVQKRGTVIA
jgi:hypothetical protein